MSKVRSLLFILMNIACYVLVLIVVLLYASGGPLYTIMLIVQGAFTVINAFVAKSQKQQIVLSANLLLSTIIANVTFTVLYLQNVGYSDETIALGRTATIIGSGFVIAVSIVAILCRNFMTTEYTKE